MTEFGNDLSANSVSFLHLPSLGKFTLQCLERFMMHFSFPYFLMTDRLIEGCPRTSQLGHLTSNILLKRNRKEIFKARQVFSMIHSARPTVSLVANIVFALNLFCFEKWGRTTRAKTMITTGRDCRSASWINLHIKLKQTLQTQFERLNHFFRIKMSYKIFIDLRINQ